MTIDSKTNRTSRTIVATREMVLQASVAARDSDCIPQGFVRLVGHRHASARPYSRMTSRPVVAPSVVPSASDEAVPIG